MNNHVPNAQPSCPICQTDKTVLWADAEDIEYQSLNQTFQYHRCPSCDILFINPVPKDQLSRIYPSNYYSLIEYPNSLSDNVKEWLDSRMFKKICKKIPSPELSVLDVGGGNGHLLDKLKKVDPRIRSTHIADIDPAAAETAQNKGHVYHCGTIEEFETDKKFDLILLLNIIEHVENPLKALQRVEHLLSHNGVALVKTPNFNSLDAKIFRHKNWGGYHCPRHWVLFTMDSFSEIVTKNKFQIINACYTQGAPFWSISIIGRLARRGWVNVSPEKPIYRHPLYAIGNAFFGIMDSIRRPFAPTSQMFFILKKNNVI